MKKKKGRKGRTMDDLYGDGSDHEACEVCGFCIDCGDCGCLHSEFIKEGLENGKEKEEKRT